MRLFLQVEIGRWPESGLERPLLHFASSLSSDLIGTDIDSQSDAVVTDMVIKLIENVDSVFLLVLVNDPLVPLGHVSTVLSHLLHHSAVKVVLRGNHETVEQLLRGFQKNLTRVNKEEEIKTLIAEFAQ